METEKQITDHAAKVVRDRARYQLDPDLWPYPCEKREEGRIDRDGLIGKGAVRTTDRCFKDEIPGR